MATQKINGVYHVSNTQQGGGGEGSDPEAVKYTPQTLTEAQKAQARTNIGAADEINGITSATASVDNTTGTPSVSVNLSNQQLSLAFSGLKGAQGNTGSSVDYPYELVNNVTTDDATKGLSAAQGVVLQGEIDQLGSKVTDLNSQVNGERTDDYTISGYGNTVGSYDFKAGKEYTFVVSSAITGTLYLKIEDADGNTIRDYSAITSFPTTFTLTPNADYEDAHLVLGYANSGTITVGVSFVGIDGDVNIIKAKVSNLEDITNPLKEVLVDSDTITSAKVIDYLATGYIYKLVISESNITNGKIYFRSQNNSQFEFSSTAVGTYYIPSQNDGFTQSIRIEASGTYSIKYSLYRIPFKDFPDTNGIFQLNYIKSVFNTLSFSWGQGYYTDAKTLNGSTQWCNSNIQFNRGRRIQLTFSSAYYVIFRHLYLNSFLPYDGGIITSGTTYNTLNFGPWMLGVRHTDYSPITPEEVSTAITIQEVDGDIYEAESGMKTISDMMSAKFDQSERVSQLESQIQRNLRLGVNELGAMMHHQNVEDERSFIPSQSILDISYAKSLGFKMIEANLQTCSDGVVVIKHGNNGKLGKGLVFAEGSGLSANTLFSAVTSTELRQYVTYDTYWAKNAVHIPTLDEFCAECARVGMIPFLRGCNAESLAIARKYLPDERIIVEGLEERGDFRGMMTSWGSGTTASAILATCKAKGQPFYYGWSLDNSVTDELFENVAKTLHENGYLLGTAYIGQEKYMELSEKGLDILVSTFNSVPFFEVGNLLNITDAEDENLVLTNATYDSTERVINISNGGTINIPHSAIGNEMSKVCLRIRYVGNLDIRFGSNNDNNRDLVGYSSNGEKDVIVSTAMRSGAQVRITANESTVVRDIKVAISIV